MEFPVMRRGSGQARPGAHRFRGTATRGHGAHVPGLLPGAPLQALAADARKVLPNRHLLERPSPDGLPGMRAVSSQLEPHAGPILTGRALGMP